MRTSFAVALAAGVASVAAVPVEKRQSSNSSSGITDAVILNYALTLEHLEATFYKQGLANFSASDFTNAGYPDWVRQRLTEIASQEATHVAFLTSGLQAAGAQAVQQCNYTFGVTSVSSFLATAQLLEGVGVSAYTGAAASIMSKSYLTAAAEILAVEARHSAWIRSDVNKNDAFPSAFTVPLTFNEVYSLAGPLITSCPANTTTSTNLPIKGFPALTASGGPFSAGGNVTLTPAAAANGTKASYVAFIGALNSTFVPYTNGSSVQIPSGFGGLVYAALTNSNSNSSSLDDIIVAGPAAFEVPIQAQNFQY